MKKFFRRHITPIGYFGVLVLVVAFVIVRQNQLNPANYDVLLTPSTPFSTEQSAAPAVTAKSQNPDDNMTNTVESKPTKVIARPTPRGPIKATHKTTEVKPKTPSVWPVCSTVSQLPEQCGIITSFGEDKPIETLFPEPPAQDEPAPTDKSVVAKAPTNEETIVPVLEVSTDPPALNAARLSSGPARGYTPEPILPSTPGGIDTTTVTAANNPPARLSFEALFGLVCPEPIERDVRIPIWGENPLTLFLPMLGSDGGCIGNTTAHEPATICGILTPQPTPAQRCSARALTL